MFSLKVNQFFLLVFLPVIIFQSCSEPTEPDSSIFEFIPLDVGNKWEYVSAKYDSNGVIEFQGTGGNLIVKDTVMNGITWYAYDYSSPGNWNTNKSNGFWVFVKANYGYSLNDTSWMVYKYPCQVGDTYGEFDYPIEVVSTNEKVTVPAGTFTTIHYSYNIINYDNYLLISNDIYICPGIGVVKSMQIGRKYDGTKFVVGQSELSSFHIKRYFGN
jgi:hypothetical protein